VGTETPQHWERKLGLSERDDDSQQLQQFCQARINALDLNLDIKERIREVSKAFEYNLQIFNALHQAGSMLAKRPGGQTLYVTGRGTCITAISHCSARQRCPS
jgi:hypothetical protein